ncbi:MAG: PIN domain-containing protein [Candidatus Methanoperedens sp.]
MFDLAVIEEVYHKLLILEVCTNYNKKPFEAVRFIKDNPHILAETEKASEIITEILNYRGLKIFEIGYHIVLEAKKIFNILLGSDAIHAATCKTYEISDIATSDNDFKRIDFLKVWKPLR